MPRLWPRLRAALSGRVLTKKKDQPWKNREQRQTRLEGCGRALHIKGKADGKAQKGQGSGQHRILGSRDPWMVLWGSAAGRNALGP